MIFLPVYPQNPSPCFPFLLTDDKTAYSKSECLRIAKQIPEVDKLPVSCRDIVRRDSQQRKAWEGASAKDRAQHAIATSKGHLGHHQLQRRLTTTTSK